MTLSTNYPEIIQKAAQNKADLIELKESVEKLNTLFTFFIGEPPLPIRAELGHRIETVSEYVPDF